MANGTPVELSEMVQGARLVIGRAFYEVDLYIIPDCAHDYILSMGFMVTYGASLDMRRKLLSLGVERATELGSPPRASPNSDYQSVPFSYTSWNRPI
jgi:hypothetical protein